MGQGEGDSGGFRLEWWDWELEISDHTRERMIDRGFTELDLRVMLTEVRSVRIGYFEDRWLLEVAHDGRAWVVIVEPLPYRRTLLVITVFPQD